MGKMQITKLTDGVWNSPPYNITFEWISGAKNKTADYLSQLVEPPTSTTTVNMLLVTHTYGPAFNTSSQTQKNSPDTTSTPCPDISPQISQEATSTPKPHIQQTGWKHYCKCRGLTHSVNIFPNIY